MNLSVRFVFISRRNTDSQRKRTPSGWRLAIKACALYSDYAFHAFYCINAQVHVRHSLGSRKFSRISLGYLDGAESRSSFIFFARTEKRVIWCEALVSEEIKRRGREKVEKRERNLGPV